MNCGYSDIALTPLLYCYKNGDSQQKDKEIFKIIHCVRVWSLWACAHMSVCILSVGMRTCEYTVCVHVGMHPCVCILSVCMWACSHVSVCILSVGMCTCECILQHVSLCTSVCQSVG